MLPQLVVFDPSSKGDGNTREEGVFPSPHFSPVLENFIPATLAIGTSFKSSVDES